MPPHLLVAMHSLTDQWGISVVSAGLQKCLCGPSGSAPITINDDAVSRIRARQHVEAGIRSDHHQEGTEARINSNYF